MQLLILFFKSCIYNLNSSFMNVPKREIEGLFQSMGNMDIWNGDSCFINKLPGEFKRY